MNLESTALSTTAFCCNVKCHILLGVKDYHNIDVLLDVIKGLTGNGFSETTESCALEFDKSSFGVIQA